MTNVLAIGKSGRIDCIADALARSSHPVKLYVLTEINNPGLLEKSEKVKVGKTDNVEIVEAYAREVQPDFAVIGPEEPLAAGVVDLLVERLGIPCVGPTQSLARLETSKSFTRNLLATYDIPGNPEYRVFRNLDGLEPYLREKEEFVIKPDGLTGGKGVKVYGEHLYSFEEVLQYCRDLFANGHQAVLVEEKLEGEEFSLQSFCDGQHVVDMPVVQDHKRAFDGDDGPNTGGMGSYSCEDHSLPFLSREYLEEASNINLAVARALLNEFGEGYKGILYGSFMITKVGLRVIEYNARFGDPEVMNVLPLLRTDFVDICEAIINGTLDRIPILFEKKATVCKYIVPEGYPSRPVKGERINLDYLPKPSDELRIYYAAVDKKSDGLYLTGSRAVAFVGIGNNLLEAERIAEDAVRRVQGPVYHRKDIGTYDLVHRRINHMKKIMKGREFSS